MFEAHSIDDRVLTCRSVVLQASLFCPPGTVHPLNCPLHAYNLAPPNSNANCSCMPGFTGTQCDPCRFALYKATNGSSVCLPCPANANTTSTASVSLNQCLCNAGYHGANGGQCAI